MSTVRSMTNKASQSGGTKRTGRPVDATVEQRVLREARSEISSAGVDAFNLTAVLRRAKVGNSGFYRRWGNVQELILDAIASVATWPEVPDLGDLRAELKVLVDTFDHPGAWTGLQLLFAFAGQSARHPDLFARYQQDVMLPSNAHVAAIFERACARGDFPPNADPWALAAAFIGALSVVKQWSIDSGRATSVDATTVLETFMTLSSAAAH